MNKNLRSYRKLNVMMFLLSLNVSVNALDPNHFTITRITAPYFVDDHNGITSYIMPT